MGYKEIETELVELDQEWNNLKNELTSQESLLNLFDKSKDDFLIYINKILRVTKKVEYSIPSDKVDRITGYERTIGLNQTGLCLKNNWGTNLTNITEHNGIDKTIKILKDKDCAEWIRNNIKKRFKDEFDELVEYLNDDFDISNDKLQQLKQKLDFNVDNNSFHFKFNHNLTGLESFGVGNSYRADVEIYYNKDVLYENKRDDTKVLDGITEKRSDFDVNELILLQLVLNNKDWVKKRYFERVKDWDKFKKKLSDFDKWFRPKLNILQAVDNL